MTEISAEGKRKQTRGVNKQRAFLQAFAVCASITEAARATQIDRCMHYSWLENPAYAALFESAKLQAAQALEDEATERATRGVFEPLIYQGEFSYELIPVLNETTGKPIRGKFTRGQMLGVWKKSDGLLMFRLRGEMAKYRAAAMEISGPNGGPLAVSLADVIRDRRAKREGTTT